MSAGTPMKRLRQTQLWFAAVFAHHQSEHEELRQIAQLSQRDRAVTCVSLGRNISVSFSLLRSLLSTELDVLIVKQMPVINALVLNNLCQYLHKSYYW